MTSTLREPEIQSGPPFTFLPQSGPPICRTSAAGSTVSLEPERRWARPQTPPDRQLPSPQPVLRGPELHQRPESSPWLPEEAEEAEPPLRVSRPPSVAEEVTKCSLTEVLDSSSQEDQTGPAPSGPGS